MMNLKSTLLIGLSNLPGLLTGRAQGTARSSAILVAVLGAVLLGGLVLAFAAL